MYCCDSSTESPASATQKHKMTHTRERQELFRRSRPAEDKAFIVRARVLKLYRQALRTARKAPAHTRDELRQTMREEMEKNRHCDDKQKIRFLISEGLQRLKELDEMLDMQGHS